MRRVALPALIVLAGSLALLLAYGVSLGEGLLYIASELGFVVYVPEILAVMLTAATATRGS